MVIAPYLKQIVSLIFFCVVLLYAGSCNKDPYTVADVTVIDTGASNTGGCGWVIEVDSTHWYQAVNLPSQYQQQGLQLMITYRQVQNTPNCTNSLYIKGVIDLIKIDNI